MRKRTVAVYMGIAVLISMFALAQSYAQEDMVTLEDSAFKDRQRPAAVFVHEGHNEKAEIEECDVCHHLYEDGKKVAGESSEDQSCSDCHTVEGEGQTPPLMKAYHDRCKECHRENKKGPVTCGECHPKK